MVRGNPAARQRVEIRWSPRRCIRSFSLVELVVVVVILGVVAGVVTPRIVRSDGRVNERSVQRVAELLSQAATRAVLTSQRVGIEHIPGDESFLQMVTLHADGFLPTWSTRAYWRPDPFVEAVRLDGVRLIAASQAWTTIGTGSWRLELEPDQSGVTLEFEDASEENRWRVDLPLGGTGAVVSRGSGTAIDAGLFDLDEAGLGREPW